MQQPSRRNLLGRLVASCALLLLLVWLYENLPQLRGVPSKRWALSQLYYVEYSEKAGLVREQVSRLLDGSARSPAPPAPALSVAGAIYAAPVTVGVRPAQAGDPVYFTLDGSIPTKRSPRYDAPISIERTTTLRARVLRRGAVPGEIATQAYVVGEDLQLPIVAVSTDPAGLYDSWSGIFSNPFMQGRAWERSAVVDYFPRAGSAAQFEAGVRVHGNYSRTFAKKSLRLRYDIGAAKRPDEGGILFPQNVSGSWEVILRQGGDGYVARLRDELFQTINMEIGGISSPFEPVFMFINGEPQGIYNLREHIDAGFLREKFGEGDYDLVVDGSRAASGDLRAFRELTTFLERHDPANDRVFAEAATMIDIDNTRDYWLLNIYAANVDWPGWNTYMFRRRDGADRRWRWISWDADTTFDLRGTELDHNTLAFATRDTLRDDLLWEYSEFDHDRAEDLEGTRIIRRLLRNPAFRDSFASRLRELLDDQLLPEKMLARLDALTRTVQHDLPADWAVWSIDKEQYELDVQRIREFIRKRPAVLRAQMQAWSSPAPSAFEPMAGPAGHYSNAGDIGYGDPASGGPVEQ